MYVKSVIACFTQSFENRRILLLYMSEQKISDFMVHFGGVAIRLAKAMIATWYNYHDFSHFQHVIPFERVSFGFTT